MTYREDFEEKKLLYLTELKGKINAIYHHKKNRKLTKRSIAENIGMVQSEFARFMNSPNTGASDERLHRLEIWVVENALEEGE